ncbi:hypothetical protein [Virgibacillus sp. SK37]|uniref:hypothetical protein n=1 Tax=Virgibacillus sp. SK37 TaxID=403957 RepID=UPI0004D1E708|nr:hypothetical protein [Virgibacillus sp. SK37]AIF42600.1 hypothetical protein X953_04485 [Virgibacillus sp. SK37]
MAKSGFYANYQGTEFEVMGNMNNQVEIITKDINKIDDTFEDTYNTGVYSKVVSRKELTDCVKVTLSGIIRGERVQILKARSDEYQVATSSLLIGEKLGLYRVDRDLWIGWIAKDKVQLVEERVLFNAEDI